MDCDAIRFVGHELPLTRAPLMGEHSEAVLCDLLGLSKAEFRALVVEDVIR